MMYWKTNTFSRGTPWYCKCPPGAAAATTGLYDEFKEETIAWWCKRFYWKK